MNGKLPSPGLLAAGVLILAAFLRPIPGHAQAAPEGMALVPEGDFWMGTEQDQAEKLKAQYSTHRLYKGYNFGWETPRRKIHLKSFYIDKTEVTNRDYARFVKATGAKPPITWNNGKYGPGLEDFPALYVTQADAEAYARWAGKRLPTEEEWEKAARGPNGQIYPWGNEFSDDKAATADSDMRIMGHALCNASSGNMTGHAPGDKSPYGAMDMGGNVREWTSSFDPENPSMKVVKGGSWLDLNLLARGAHREFVYKYFKSHIIGFRCAKDAG